MRITWRRTGRAEFRSGRGKPEERQDFNTEGTEAKGTEDTETAGVWFEKGGGRGLKRECGGQNETGLAAGLALRPVD